MSVDSSHYDLNKNIFMKFVEFRPLASILCFIIAVNFYNNAHVSCHKNIVLLRLIDQKINKLKYWSLCDQPSFNFNQWRII